MAKAEFSTKRLAIDKANASLIIAVAVATFIVTFSLVASKTLLDQRAYQSKVIQKKEKARDTLEDNIAAVETLNSSYQEFANSSVNVLGGSKNGTGDKDGENPRIVLDALPSKYDFPALATSIEKLLKGKSFAIANITGTDDEIAQAGNTSSDAPTPIEIPFSVEASTSSGSAKQMIQLYEKSIRPIKVDKLEVVGQNGKLQITVTGKTYFQPAKGLNVRNEAVK